VRVSVNEPDLQELRQECGLADLSSSGLHRRDKCGDGSQDG